MLGLPVSVANASTWVLTEGDRFAVPAPVRDAWNSWMALRLVQLGSGQHPASCSARDEDATVGE